VALGGGGRAAAVAVVVVVLVVVIVGRTVFVVGRDEDTGCSDRSERTLCLVRRRLTFAAGITIVRIGGG
jgi:hypothetical protein